MQPRFRLGKTAGEAVLWFDNNRHVLLMAMLLVVRGTPYLFVSSDRFSPARIINGFMITEPMIGAACVLVAVGQIAAIKAIKLRLPMAFLSTVCWGYFTVGLLASNGVGSPGMWTSGLMMTWSLYAIVRSVWWR